MSCTSKSVLNKSVKYCQSLSYAPHRFLMKMLAPCSYLILFCIYLFYCISTQCRDPVLYIFTGCIKQHSIGHLKVLRFEYSFSFHLTKGCIN